MIIMNNIKNNINISEPNITSNLMDWDLKLISNNDKLNEIDDIINKLKNNNTITNNNVNMNIIKNDNNNDTISQLYTNWDKFDKPKLYYNNLNKDGKTEIITQNVLTFDSIDRDTNKYPNPFNYKVKFNPNNNNNDAFISKNYKNVKYLSLEYIIIPRKFYLLMKDLSNTNDNLNDINNLMNDFNNIYSNMIINNFKIPDINNIENINKMEECWEIEYNIGYFKLTYYYFSPYLVENDKHLLLNIDEITNNYNYSTNENIQKSFGILLPNLLNGDYYYLDTKIIEKIYKYSDLGNIDQLTLNILNSNGIPLNININTIDYNNNTPKNCICSYDNRKYNCSCTYIRHKLYHKFQNLLLFKIGYIEPNIDKRVFD